MGWQRPNSLSLRKRVEVKGIQLKQPVSVQARFDVHPKPRGSNEDNLSSNHMISPIGINLFRIKQLKLLL